MILALVGVLVTLLHVNARINTGFVQFEASSFLPIGRFVFDVSGGHLGVALSKLSSITEPSPTNVQSAKNTQLVVFKDVNWKAAKQADYSTTASCEDAIGMLAARSGMQVLSFSLNMTSDPYKIEVVPATNVVPRFWYMVLINCGDATTPPGGVGLDYYNLTFTNRPGLTSYHFSKDELGCFTGSVIFACAYFLMYAYATLSKHKSKRAHHDYQVMKAIVRVVMLSLLSMFAMLVHYAAYAGDGVGYVSLTGISFILDAMAQSYFLGLLLFLSKGWTINTYEFDSKQMYRFVMVIYLLIYVCMYLWHQLSLSIVDLDFFYFTPPGVVILTIRGVIVVVFLRNMFATYSEHTSQLAKRMQVLSVEAAEGNALSKKLLVSGHQRIHFYRALAVFGVLWGLALIVTVIIVNFVDPWVQNFVAFLAPNILSIVFYLALMVVFHPDSCFVVALDPEATMGWSSNKTQIFPMTPQQINTAGAMIANRMRQQHAESVRMERVRAAEMQEDVAGDDEDEDDTPNLHRSVV